MALFTVLFGHTNSNVSSNARKGQHLEPDQHMQLQVRPGFAVAYLVACWCGRRWYVHDRRSLELL